MFYRERNSNAKTELSEYIVNNKYFLMFEQYFINPFSGFSSNSI